MQDWEFILFFRLKRDNMSYYDLPSVTQSFFRNHLSPGLEISTRKLAKCEWFFEVASLKNILKQTFAS